MNAKSPFLRGIFSGIPIALGYFAVAMALGIAAQSAGFNALQATLSSFLLNASAGEYIGFTLVAAHETYFTVTLMEGVANARYFLMSCALSQKLAPTVPTWKRLLLGYGVTDEIFGISVAQEGHLNPAYSYGAMAVAIPAWSLGTLMGFLLGSVLPARLISALSVSLYAMFISVFVPEAKRNRAVLGLFLFCFGASALATWLPLLSGISSGVKILLLTITISLAAAIFFPRDEDGEVLS